MRSVADTLHSALQTKSNSHLPFAAALVALSHVESPSYRAMKYPGNESSGQLIIRVTGTSFSCAPRTIWKPSSRISQGYCLRSLYCFAQYFPSYAYLLIIFTIIATIVTSSIHINIHTAHNSCMLSGFFPN